ncbi:MAG: DUF2277 domain-containing protein [Pseudomonadota bacterium]
MCRNIKTLFNFDPVASDLEIEAAALQFVRKVSGSTKPSRVNEAAFEQAVNDISQSVRTLLDSLTTQAPPRNRAVEADRARRRAAQRFAKR